MLFGLVAANVEQKLYFKLAKRNPCLPLTGGLCIVYFRNSESSLRYKRTSLDYGAEVLNVLTFRGVVTCIDWMKMVSLHIRRQLFIYQCFLTINHKMNFIHWNLPKNWYIFEWDGLTKIQRLQLSPNRYIHIAIIENILRLFITTGS